MKINCFSVTFWFNIFDNHNDALGFLQNELSDEFKEFQIYNYTDNLINPVINAFNDKLMTSLIFSQINLQYYMDNVNINDYDKFQDRVLKLFNILNEIGIEVSHTALFINGEKEDKDALNTIRKNTISKSLYNDDLVDATLKLGYKHEDLFYKIITILNKKQVKLPELKDEKNRLIPIPLISWSNAEVENSLVDVSYELNDKYSFDNTKNYKTTEFYLNKMLYVLKDNFEDDINNVIKKGKIN